MTEAIPLSPSAIAEWIPFAKAAGFFLATFVLEDVAAVGAGLLLATGGISWPAAFAACFLGIWMGDAGLYALARYAGRGWFERSSLRRFTTRLGRWRHWEFWPAWMFYPPVGVYCAWLALKYRGLTVVTAANPGIFSGGMVGESKMATLKELFLTSPEFTAETELIAGDTLAARLRSLDAIRTRLGLDFPFILKPDVGQRGAGIKLIRWTQQAEDYLRQTSAPLVAQRYAPGPLEAGIFYYRFPHEARGHIFAITEKLFPILIGDGKSTVTELIWSDPRARFMADKYLQRFSERQGEVLPAGGELKLVEAGNHAQGCIFRDGMRLCTPELESRMDAISQKVTGFFIGRYDIRYASEENLRAGGNFQIIELNGAASEATSIYDARNSIFAAYRTLFRQWDLVFAIGSANRKRGCTPTKLSLVCKSGVSILVSPLPTRLRIEASNLYRHVHRTTKGLLPWDEPR